MIQTQIQAIIHKTAQPVIRKDIIKQDQHIIRKEIQPVIHKEIQPVIRHEI